MSHIVTNEEYAKFKKDSLFLEYLKAAGVDNWTGYSDAHRMMEEEE